MSKDTQDIINELKFNIKRVGNFSHVANGTKELSNEMWKLLEKLEKEIINLENKNAM